MGNHKDDSSVFDEHYVDDGVDKSSMHKKKSEDKKKIVDNQNSRKNKVAFTEMEEFVWSHQIHDEEACKRKCEDVFMHNNVEDANVHVEEKKDEAAAGLTEVVVGKGLSGTLQLLKDRGTLKESSEWSGRNMDKKKRKLVEIVEDEGKKEPNIKEIQIERRDEFGRILTSKEAFRLFSHKFHGKGPGKTKHEKRMKQFYQELKLKQMNSSDTPSLFVERMREAQARMKTPYLVLSGFTPMLGDRKKRKVE